MDILDMKPFTVDGKPYVAYVVPDTDSSPGDADCYTLADLAAYDGGDWCFVGLIVRDEQDNEASVWSVHYGESAEWSVDMDHLMSDDYYVPALVREIQEVKP